jgi:hypothetical protein
LIPPESGKPDSPISLSGAASQHKPSSEPIRAAHTMSRRCSPSTKRRRGDYQRDIRRPEGFAEPCPFYAHNWFETARRKKAEVLTAKLTAILSDIGNL